MSDPIAKFVVPNANLHFNPKASTTPKVDPVLQHGGPTPDPWTALKQTVMDLQEANSKLTDRVAELEKEMLSVRLILSGVDPAFAAVKKEIHNLSVDYAGHVHRLPFNYESFRFMAATPTNNQENFVIPCMWEGSLTPKTEGQKRLDGEKAGAATATPISQSDLGK